MPNYTPDKHLTLRDKRILFFLCSHTQCIWICSRPTTNAEAQCIADLPSDKHSHLSLNKNWGKTCLESFTTSPSPAPTFYFVKPGLHSPVTHFFCVICRRGERNWHYYTHVKCLVLMSDQSAVLLQRLPFRLTNRCSCYNLLKRVIDTFAKWMVSKRVLWRQT